MEDSIVCYSCDVVIDNYDGAYDDATECPICGDHLHEKDYLNEIDSYWYDEE